MNDDIEDDHDVSPVRVIWLMECFKAAFDQLANHAGFNNARGYEMLNALALEASSLIKSADPEQSKKFRRYFLTAFGASLQEGDDESSHRKPH